jgi:manganese/zinc/iron transport system substrate-binding protein
MWNLNFIVISMILTTTLLLSSCTSNPAELASIGAGTNSKLRVVATTGMITDLIQRVGGDRVEVTGMMGPGIDPHQFKASAGNVRSMERAEVIFYNGLHLEAGLGNVLERMGEQRKVIAVAEVLDQTLLIAPQEFEGAYDPHIWFDVSLWMRAVEKVRATLSEIDPDGAALYQANAAAYLEELTLLHTYVLEQAKRVPAERRVLITAHDAFNYFGKAYGFEVRGLQGISTSSEASTGDIQALASFIVERQIPAVFVETSVPQRTIEAVQAAVQAKGFRLHIGGELYSDALGDPGTPEGTYTGMVRHNIDTIVEALLGE